MSKQDKGTGKGHQLPADKATKIEPLEGWERQTKYGTLRLRDGTDCVRLADVQVWMARDGKPIDTVISEIFGPLLVAAGDVCHGYTREEANSIRILSALHLVKVMGYPVPLFEHAESCRWNVDPLKCENVYSVGYRGALGLGHRVTEANIERYVPQITFAREMDISALRAAFPDQGHYACEDGTVAGLLYAIFTGAKRLLAVGVDVHTDAQAAHERKIEAIAEKNYEIKWPRDEVVTSFLNRLAVPISVAHELWGWGRAVAVEVETQAAPAKVAPKLSGWAEVVVIKKANKDAPLTLAQKRALAAEFERRKANRATGIAKAMAAELGGISVSAFNELKKAEPGKREAKQIAKQEAERNGITTVVGGRKVA